MSTFTTPNPVTAAGARVRITASECSDTVVRVRPVNAANSTDVKVAEKTKVEFADGVLSVKTTNPDADEFLRLCDPVGYPGSAEAMTRAVAEPPLDEKERA
jgi:hypothetical protein